MITKKQLAIKLSKLRPFSKPRLSLEQYNIDSEIAALILWTAYLNNDINGKVIADLGCGNGILGKGALLFGAKRVYFLDKDKEAIKLAKENVNSKKAVFLNKDVADFNKKVNTVIQNPPFGTKEKHIDKIFLEKAMEIGNKIYSIHKITSKNFIKAVIKNKFRIKGILEFNLQLKSTYRFHRKKYYKVKVGCWILERKM